MDTLTALTPAPSDTEPRFVAVRVNLLPDEVVAGRRTDVLRRRVLVGLAALAALIVLGFGISWWQTHSANSDLEAAQSRQAELQQQSKQYAPLIAAKSDTAQIRSELRQLLASDVSWNQLLRTVRAAAPQGVTVTQLDGSTVDATASSASASTPVGAGSLIITGEARDKNSVANFADTLSRVHGLGSAQPTNTATADGRTNWTIVVPLTADALRVAGGK